MARVRLATVATGTQLFAPAETLETTALSEADRREGTLIYYRLAGEHLVTLLGEGRTVVEDLEEDRLDFPAIPEQALENCPCPRCQI